MSAMNRLTNPSVPDLPRHINHCGQYQGFLTDLPKEYLHQKERGLCQRKAVTREEREGCHEGYFHPTPLVSGSTRLQRLCHKVSSYLCRAQELPVKTSKMLLSKKRFSLGQLRLGFSLKPHHFLQHGNLCIEDHRQRTFFSPKAVLTGSFDLQDSRNTHSSSPVSKFYAPVLVRT